MTVVVVAKGLDLSVGSTMALAGSMETLVAVTYGLPWWAGLLSGLLVGLLVGVVNSLLITRVKISPIITTLGTMGIVRGTAFVITNGQSIFIQSPPLEWIGLGRVLGIPVPVIIMIAIFSLFWWVCRFTVFGRYIYSIGGNAVASRLAGIRVNRIVAILYIVTGGLSALSGMVIVGFSATSLPSAGAGYELDIITAVLLGGASLEGGEGSVWRTLLGVVIIGIINNGMALLNVPPYWQILSKGALLLLAVAADKLKQ
jgi:ribose/xylose/arabinose/galactoside ABC-type transport system permease subunit